MANHIPIQDLDTSTSPPTDRAIRAVVTLSWPYSSSTRQCALLLADPDFRLRSRKGQVRVRFSGAAARAVAERRLGIGDEVELDLTGARWVNEQAAVATPGKSVGELEFAKGLRLRVRQGGSEQVEVLVDGSAGEDEERTKMTRGAEPVATPMRKPSGVDQFRSKFGSAPGSFAIYSSPAFARRSRLSYLDGVSRLFEDEWEIEEQPRKKARVSLGEVRDWRMVSRSPSPVKESFDLPPAEKAPAQEDEEMVVVLDDDFQAPASGEPVSSPVIAETPDQDVLVRSQVDEEDVKIDDDVPLNAFSHAEDAVEPLSNAAQHILSSPAMPEQQSDQSSTARTMLPPALPRLQMPSSSPERAAEQRDGSDGPLAPRLQPIPSGGLPLPSPFPADNAAPKVFAPADAYTGVPDTYAGEDIHAMPQRRPQQRERRPRVIQDTYAEPGVDEDDVLAMSQSSNVSHGINGADSKEEVAETPEPSANHSITNAPYGLSVEQGGIGTRSDSPGPPLLDDESSDDDDGHEDAEIDESDTYQASDDEADEDAMLEDGDEVEEVIEPEDLGGVEPSDDESEEEEEDSRSRQSALSDMPGQSQGMAIDIENNSGQDQSAAQADIPNITTSVRATEIGLPTAASAKDTREGQDSSPTVEQRDMPPTELESTMLADTTSAAPLKPSTPPREPSPFVSGFDHHLQRDSGFALPALDLTPVAKSREAPLHLPGDRAMKQTFKSLFGFRGSQSPEKEVLPAQEQLSESRAGEAPVDGTKTSTHGIALTPLKPSPSIAADSFESQHGPMVAENYLFAQAQEAQQVFDTNPLPSADVAVLEEVGDKAQTPTDKPPSTAQVIDLLGSSSDVEEDEVPAQLDPVLGEEVHSSLSDDPMRDASGSPPLASIKGAEAGDPLNLLSDDEAEPVLVNPFVLAGPEEERRKSEHAIVSEGPSEEIRPPSSGSPLFSVDDTDRVMQDAFGGGSPIGDAHAIVDLDYSYPPPPASHASEPTYDFTEQNGVVRAPEGPGSDDPSLPQFDGFRDNAVVVDDGSAAGHLIPEQAVMQVPHSHPPSVGDAAIQSGTSSFRELSPAPSVVPEQFLAHRADHDYEMLDLSQAERETSPRQSQAYRLSQMSQRSRFSEVELVEDSIDSPQSTIAAESSPHSAQADATEDFEIERDTIGMPIEQSRMPADSADGPAVLLSQELGQDPPLDNFRDRFMGAARDMDRLDQVPFAGHADVPPTDTARTEVVDLVSSFPVADDGAADLQHVNDRSAQDNAIVPAIIEQQRDDELLEEFAHDQAAMTSPQDSQQRSREAEMQPSAPALLPAAQQSALVADSTSEHAQQSASQPTALELQPEISYPRLPLSPSFSQSQSLDLNAQPTDTVTLEQPFPITPMLTESASDLRAMVPATQLSAVETSQQDAHTSRSQSQQQEAPPEPANEPKTPSRKSLRSRLSHVPDVISAWFSPKRSGTTTAKVAEQDSQDSAPGNVEASPIRQANGYRTDHSYFTSLCSLEKHLNHPSQQVYDGATTVDVLAVVTDFTKAPERAKGGPRDYFTVFQVTDASVSDMSGTRVEVFRPWKAVLPAADIGDVVLLRAFAVKSRKRKTYLLSTDASAWCVWRFAEQRGVGAQEEAEKPAWARRRADSDVREEVKGPPVEYGRAEREQAVKLRAWWLASRPEQDNEHGRGEVPSEATVAKL